ncbi:hypothetical protein Bbelb_235850 [Branchiostoma belcheri]|nr:hypothetical protein Bbelb_235850 [Branchiostoma belcheri]
MLNMVLTYPLRRSFLALQPTKKGEETSIDQEAVRTDLSENRLSLALTFGGFGHLRGIDLSREHQLREVLTTSREMKDLRQTLPMSSPPLGNLPHDLISPYGPCNGPCSGPGHALMAEQRA